MLEKAVRALQFSPSLVWGLSSKVVGALTAPLTTILVALYFTPELQGFFYTFISLIAIQSLVELGPTGVITTFASHEWAHLRRAPDGTVEGDPRALSRLKSLLGFSARWFLSAGALITALLVIVGFAFFGNSAQFDWRGPWVAVSLLVGLNLALTPAWAVLQACGAVEQVNFSNLMVALLRTAAAWTAIVLGGELWTAVAAIATTFVWACGFLAYRYRAFFASIWRAPVTEHIEWKRDILPLQWRTAVMWPAGYLMFSLFTPALFHYQGPAEAGRMGMSWAIVSGISGLAATWLQVRVPEFGALVAQRRFAELDRITRHAAIVCFLVSLAAGMVLLGVLAVLEAYAPAIRDRLLPIAPLVIFLAAETLHQVSFAQSSYLRAFKQEPFFLLSVTTGWFVGIATIISAKHFGAVGISIAYFLAIVLALVWGTRIFADRRSRWIAEART